MCLLYKWVQLIDVKLLVYKLNKCTYKNTNFKVLEMKQLILGFTKFTAASVLVASLVACGGAEDRKIKYLEKGKSYLEQGNLKKARIEFKNVMQIDPKSAQAYFYMGLVAERTKEVNKSFGYYKEAVKLKPDYIEPKLKLAEIYTVIGSDEYIDKAEKLLSGILTQDNKNTKARLIQQQINYKKGNVDLAIKEIEKLVMEDLLLDNGINLLVSEYVSKGKIDKAISLLDQGINADEKNLTLRNQKVALLFREKRFSEVEKELTEILNQNKSVFSSYLTLSSFYAKTNQLEKAEQVLRDGIKEDEDDVKRILVLVQFIVLRKNPDEAIKELEKAIDSHPDAYELNFAMAKIYTAIDKKEKAKEVYVYIDKESSSDTDKANANNMLAELLLKDGKIDEAKALLSKVLLEHPDNNDALKLSSDIALQEKDFTTVINQLRIVLKSQPERADISKVLAQAHMALNEFSLAESVLKNATQVNVKNVTAYVNYIAFLINQKRLSEAEEVLKYARKFNKKSYELLNIELGFAGDRNDVNALKMLLDEMKQMYPDKSDIYIKRGQFYYATKDYDKALEEFKVSLKKATSPPESIRAIEKIVGFHISRNEPEKALVFLKKAVSDNPKDILFHYTLANLYVSQKDMPNAINHYKIAISINDKWPQPYINLSSVYAKEGNVGQAVELLENASRITEGNLKIESSLASYYEMQNKFEDAKKVYERILVKMPTSALALNNLASLLLDHSTTAAEIKMALKYAQKLDTSKNPAFQDTLAWAYAKSGDNVKALALLKPIVERHPNLAIFRYHLGDVLYNMDDKAAAKTHLKIAVSSEQVFTGKDKAISLLNSI